jgi:hypothetical protein
MFSPVEFAETATQTALQANSNAAEKFALQIDVTAMTQEPSHDLPMLSAMRRSKRMARAL